MAPLKCIRLYISHQWSTFATKGRTNENMKNCIAAVNINII